jgi:methyl-accepting chemotaxis protein
MTESTPGTGRELPGGGNWRRALRERIRYIPRGESIPDETWRARHRNILVLLVAHVPFLFALGRFTGTEQYVTGATFTAEPLPVVVGALCVLLGLAALASWSRFGRRTRTGIAAVGLMVSSAQLVYFSGGFIEAHFHFFVMMGVVAIYEDWVPFVVGIAYVAIQHGVFGMFNPEAVYNHPAAVANPWGWALVHALFILGLSTALIQNWISIERSREETRRQIEHLEESDEQIETLEAKQAEIEQARAEAEEAKAEAERRQREVERLNEQLLVRADEIADAMAAVSAGDLTAEPPEEDDIEAVAEIGDAFGAMTRELSATVRDIREFATTVERTTQSVHDDAETLERSQEDLASDVREFAADIREQAGDLESTTDELSTLSATIEEIAANAEQVSAEAGDAADAAQSGTGTAAEAVAAIEEIEGSVGELADLVESLDGRMDVVAEEVKTLADETRDHSAAIGDAIEGTVADVERVQTELAETKARIETGRTTMTEAGDAFEDLAATVDEVDTAVDEVAAATDDGARTTETVVDAIERVAERSLTVAERSESLADRAETGAGTVSEIRAQLDDLTDQTATLQNRLADFECESPDSAGATAPSAADD